MSTPYEIQSTWIGIANCGTPYFFCRADPAYNDVVKTEMRYIRPRGGDLVLLEGIQVQEAIDKMMGHWPKTNPVESIDTILFRIAPHTIQE